ncbi:MAG: aerobic carbon-monoxide dehydrogenase large subunit [Actinomycetota bacterium]|jgi:carbon-monoxide dehydrogenase large subunit|nr:aerobic carbon-monoxide dehydrogenase large subunit [Actinomycetota bacterium]
MVSSVRPRLFGARVARVEDPRFLMGRAKYVDDITLPGMIHATFVRSPFAHAEITSINVADALNVKGVIGVRTGRDLEGVVKPIRCDPVPIHPTWQTSAADAIATARVRYVGEAVAMVLAEDRYIAEDGAALVEIDYDPLEAVSTIDKAISADAPLLHDGWRDNVILKTSVSGGDVDSAFAEADGIIKMKVRTNRHAAIPLETRGTVASYDPAEELLTFWTATQAPHIVRTGIADHLGMPEHRIRVISPDVGGGFGVKAHLYPEDLALAAIAVELARPIKWIEDRREHFLASTHSREHVYDMEVAYRADGLILGMKSHIYVDCGAYSVYPWTAGMEQGMAMRILPGPYRIRNFEAQAWGVVTNKSTLGPYRGVARPSACFAIERAMDRVAHAVNGDPVDVRMLNLVDGSEFPYESITGLTYDSGSFKESLQKVRENIDYDEFRLIQRDARAEGRLLGIGVACFTEQTAHTTTEFVKRAAPIIPANETVAIRMDPSGKVTVHTGAHSHGQSHETTIGQIVADKLTIPLKDVRVLFGDTQTTPYGTGTLASRTAVLSGGAAMQASGQIGERLKILGAHILEASVEDVELEEGQVRIKGAPEQNIEVAQLARFVYHRAEKLPPGFDPYLEATGAYDAFPGSGTFANASQMAIVEVDPETGGVTILRYVVVEDCGPMINPTVVEGQVQGGIAQGIGGALYEELIYDDEGQLLTTTFLDYLVPSTMEVPGIEVGHLETPSPFTIGGMKGAGEGGAIAPGAVIAAAVENAIGIANGVFVDEVPLTPERVRKLVVAAAQVRGSDR